MIPVNLGPGMEKGTTKGIELVADQWWAIYKRAYMLTL